MPVRLRLLLVLVLSPLLVLTASCGMNVEGPQDTIESGEPGQAPEPSGTGEAGDGSECEYVADDNAAKEGIELPPMSDVEHEGSATFTIHMEAGDVTITMDRARTPCTVNSFESLVAQKFYDDTACHRLVDSGIFVLQCGDPTGTGTGGPGYTYADETSPEDSYDRGTVAMANAGPDTNGSQFFLVWDDSPLPPDYTVFGHMDEKSINVVAGIAAEGQDGSGSDGSGRPLNHAKITNVTKG